MQNKNIQKAEQTHETEQHVRCILPGTQPEK